METELYLGKNALRTNRNPVQGQQVTLDGEPFHRISNYDRMRPFFMTVVSDADHWLFISACREQCATSVWWRRQSKPATRSSNASAANIFRSPSVGDMATRAGLGTNFPSPLATPTARGQCQDAPAATLTHWAP